jgi:hypothetical protein
MTRDEALLWLTNRIGKSVWVEVAVKRGDDQVLVLGSRGTLSYWSEHAPRRQPIVESRDELAGYYAVGAEAHLDLSDLADAEAVRTLEDELVIRLGDDVVLHIVEQTAFDHREGPVSVMPSSYSRPMEDRGIDEVRIELPGGTVSIPWSSRDRLLEQLETRESIADVPDVRDAFEAAGTSRPVRLTDPQRLALRKVITFWANEMGGSYDELPEGIHDLRNSLHDVDLPVPDEALDD